MGIKFNMIDLFVNNLRTMVTFYKNVIGVDIDWGRATDYAGFKHDGIRFSMYARTKLCALLGKTPSYPEGINGTFELAINVHTKEAVDAFYENAIKNGARPIYTPRDEPWKMRSAMIADPENNLIEIASDFWE